MKTRSRTYRSRRNAEGTTGTKRKNDNVRVTRAMASKRPRRRNNQSRQVRQVGEVKARIQPDLVVSNLSATTRDSVLGTVELLEQILSYLPFRSMFLCQTVCKHFRDVIAQSSQIQKSLWLRCDELPDQQQWTVVDSVVDSTTMYNTAAMRLLRSGEEAPKNVYTPARMCPLLDRQSWFDGPQNEHLRQNSALRISREQGEWMRLNLEALGSYTKPIPVQPPSWYKIQVSNPPCHSANVDLHFVLVREYPKSGTWQVGEMTVRKSVKNESSGGLKMGDLVRLDNPEEILTWTINGRYYTKIKDPARLVARMEKRYKAKMYLAWDNYRTHLVLDGFVFPFDEEWRRVAGPRVSLV